MKRIAFASLAVLSLVALTTSVVVVRLNRDDAENLVERADDCAAGKLTDQDLRWGTEETRKKRDDKRDACAAREEAERVAAAERAAAEQRVRLEAEKVAKRAAECKRLADETAAGALGDAAVATAGPQADFMKRIAMKKLLPSDLGPTDPTFPCADTKDAAALEAGFKAVLLAEPASWARHPDPSPYLGKVLLAAKAELPNTALIGLADNAERTAKAGLSRGEKETIARAKKLCALADSLGVSGHAGCKGIANL